MCPYYLDGDNCHIPRRFQITDDLVTSVVGAHRRLIDRRCAVMSVQFSKNAEEAVARVSHDGLSKLNSMPRPGTPTAGDGNPVRLGLAGQVRSTFQAARA
jgi:hypothetical protein